MPKKSRLTERSFIPEDGKKFEIKLYGLVVNVTDIKDHRIEKTVVCLQNPILKVTE